MTDLLKQAGVSCQLKFIEAEADRDKVVVSDEDGRELAVDADLQHNKHYGKLKLACAEMSNKVLVALGKSAPGNSA
jgi:hypothetical protein